MLSILQVGLLKGMDDNQSTSMTFHKHSIPRENIHSYVHELVFTTLKCRPR